ncbi:MAG: hypothetical protein JSV33_09290 [bacterium]|nr:MAG: hypothetical protein JSV33_09290 [bacterium]
MHSILPDSAVEWRSESEDRIFTRETIFDYMNGAGEIYLSYDFEELLIREYSNPSGPSIVVEVYRMGSPEDAYGVFTHDTEGETVDVGEDAVYSSGFLMFWKGRIFMRILAERETPEAKKAIMHIAEHAAGVITGRGRVPTLVSCLPADGLREREIRYFHKPLSLNIHYFIADANILDLDEKTDAVLARYDIENQKPRILVVAYPSPSDARRAYEQFIRVYLRGNASKSDNHIAQIEKGEYVGAHHINRFSILVFECSTKGMCETLTARTAEKLKEVFK